MSYIGNQPTNTAFLIDTFSGNSATTSFNLSVAPASASAILVTIGGILQDTSAYGVVGRILTFSGVPPTGTNNISVRYLGLPASNITTPAYRTVTDLTATAGQTTFSTAGYTPGFIDVYRNGVKLAAADFTATNGAQVVLVNPAIAGDTITTVSFFVSSVANAIPGTTGIIGSSYIADGAVTPSKIDVLGTGLGALQLPKGTTVQRPTGVNGLIRYNTTDLSPEYYSGSSWISLGSKDGSTSAKAAASAKAIKSVLGNPVSGVYWLQVTGVNSNLPFQCWCDFTIDGGAGYAIIYNNYFTGSTAGPTFTTMSSTSLTGTVDKFSNHVIAPTTMMANYGLTKLAVFATTNNGITTGGIQSSTTFRWVAFSGPTAAQYVQIFTNSYSANQFTGAFNSADGNSGTAYFPNSHGNSGGVMQITNGTTVNDNLLYEYKYDGGLSDPNHYWMVANGRAGDAYFAGNGTYGSNSGNVLYNRWGGVAIY